MSATGDRRSACPTRSSSSGRRSIRGPAGGSTSRGPISRMFRPLPAATSCLPPSEWLGHWQDCCRWIAENTPPTPDSSRRAGSRRSSGTPAGPKSPRGRTFRRTRPASFAWRQTLGELYPTDASALGARSGCIQRRGAARAGPQVQLPVHRHRPDPLVAAASACRSVYPLFREENPAFEVFRVPPDVADRSP